jgi:hypothetical protein
MAGWIIRESKFETHKDEEFSLPQCPGWLRGPASHLCNGYRVILSLLLKQPSHEVDQLQLVSRLRKHGFIFHSPCAFMAYCYIS